MAEHQDTVIVTDSTGFIGSALINRFAGRFALIGLDRATAHQPPPAAECVCIDLTSEQGVADHCRRIQNHHRRLGHESQAQNALNSCDPSFRPGRNNFTVSLAPGACGACHS
jgi:nucleoside-diphosphate-sugar epimerase